MGERRNLNRGYRKLIVWQDAIAYYVLTCQIALGSTGESVSGWHAFLEAKQITDEQFEQADALAFKLENGMMRLVASLRDKQDTGEWSDTLILKESNTAYGLPTTS